jgi:hypothetical protein
LLVNCCPDVRVILFTTPLGKTTTFGLVDAPA